MGYYLKEEFHRMKTLKKTLSLTLVFALVFSLMSFAFAAPTAKTTATKLSDFTDKDQLTYTEAADYLIAAGVVKGDTDTTLNPKGDLTREQAAKLMAYAMLGQAAADNLKTAVAPFKDVAADRWSAGYIAYCVQVGVINGLGDGNFGPNDKVTGYQMAKMLLCSLGYGVNGEFTGPGWALETAKYALAKDIFHGNTAGASDAPANREEAFLYTFNALTRAMLVKYNDSLKVYYSGTNPFENNQNHNVDYTIGRQRFKMVKVETSVGPKGEARHYWAIDGKKVTGNYANKPVTVLTKSSNGTAYGKLISNAYSEYIGFDKDEDKDTAGNMDFRITYNGVKLVAAAGTDVRIKDANGDYQTMSLAGAPNVTLAENAATARVGSKGVEVSFIDTDNDGKYNTVAIVDYTFAEVTGTTAVKTTGNVTTVTIPGIPSLSNVNVDNVTGYEGIEKGDIVGYYIKGGEYILSKATPATGTIFGYNAQGGKINFNGKTVDVSDLGLTDMNEIAGSNYVGVEGVTVYTDANGYVVMVAAPEGVTSVSNMLYVKATTASSVLEPKVEAVFSDGTSAIITVTKVDTTTVTKTNVEDYAGKFYSYSKNSATGAYTLTTLPNTSKANATKNYTANGALLVKNGTAAFLNGNDADFAAGTTLYATSATVFVYAKNSGNGYSAYTGISNTPNYNAKASGTDAQLAVYADKDGYAKLVVAYDGVVGASNANDYMFVTLPASMNYVDKNNPYAIFSSAVINGEVKDVNAIDTMKNLQPGLLVKIEGYEGDKISSAEYNADSTDLIADLNGVTMPVGGRNVTVGLAQTFTYSDGVLKSNYTHDGTSINNVLVLNKDCKVFYWDGTKATPTIETTSAAALESLDNTAVYSLQAIQKSTTDNTITQVFVGELPAATVAVANALIEADNAGTAIQAAMQAFVAKAGDQATAATDPTFAAAYTAATNLQGADATNLVARTAAAATATTNLKATTEAVTAALTNLSGATADTLMGLLAANVTASPAFTATTAANADAYKTEIATFKAATTIKAVNDAMATVDVKAVADGITTFAPAAAAAGTVSMPTVPAGYTIAVKTSSDETTYDTDGKLVADGTSNVVWTVTQTASGKTADTISVAVTVNVTP